jgi:hypothetical protein
MVLVAAFDRRVWLELFFWHGGQRITINRFVWAKNLSRFTATETFENYYAQRS